LGGSLRDCRCGVAKRDPRINHRLPTGAAAQVREQGLLGGITVLVRRALGPKALVATDDSRRAEAALTSTGCGKCLAPLGRNVGGQTINGGDLAAAHASYRSDTRNPRLAIHQHSAAAALSLRATAILHGTHTHDVTQDIEQRCGVIFDLDLLAVDRELHSSRHRENATGAPEASETNLRRAADYRYCP
jgi:hypothetical protein